MAALAALLLLLGGCGGCNAANGGADAPAQPAPTAFGGERAMEWLQKQCALGARVPGTPEHTAGRALLAEALGPGTEAQEFTYARRRRAAIPMANLVARFGPAEGTRVLLCAHWDSRPTADQDPDPANRAKPVMGANDGASGVAVLLELARLYRVSPPPVGVTIVLFDGEDYGPGIDDMFLGSRYFAEHVVGGPFRFGILLDMVGDADLQIYREGNSQALARSVVDRVWRAALDLGYNQFRDSVRHTIQDDHLPLLAKGIPVIDVIDFDYPPWHTINDTPDKCSAASLKAVGDVVHRVVAAERP